MTEQRHKSGRDGGSASGRRADPAANRFLIHGAAVFFTGAMVFSSAARHVMAASGGCACPACCASLVGGRPTEEELERQTEDVRTQILRSAGEGRRQ